MAALYSMPVCAAGPEASAPYKRVLVCPHRQKSRRQVAMGDSDSAESGSDDDESGPDADVDEELSNLNLRGYLRYAPTRAPDVDYWTSEGGNRGLYNSTRASDTGSIASKRSSNGEKRMPRHNLLTIFSPGHTTHGQIASVRKHHGSDRRKGNTRSLSESSVPTISHTKRPDEESKSKTGRTGRKTESSADMRIPGIFSALMGPSPRSKPKRPVVAKRVTCVSCLADDISSTEAKHLKCDHWMCNPCIKRLFELSTTDSQLMPPRCCNEYCIQLKDVVRLFDQQFVSLWKGKFAEYSTKGRLYCPNEGCGAWIRPENIRNIKVRSVTRQIGTCSKCKSKVCKKCHCIWHGTKPCPDDDGTKKVLDMQEEEGWQRCYRCKAVVERDDGCNHMTCRCGAQFCYLCGKKWRDEKCQQNCPLFPVPNELELDEDWMVPMQVRTPDLEENPWAFPERQGNGRASPDSLDRRARRRRRRLYPRRADPDIDGIETNGMAAGEVQGEDEYDLALALQTAELAFEGDPDISVRERRLSASDESLLSQFGTMRGPWHPSPEHR